MCVSFCAHISRRYPYSFVHPRPLFTLPHCWTFLCKLCLFAPCVRYGVGYCSVIDFNGSVLPPSTFIILPSNVPGTVVWFRDVAQPSHIPLLPRLATLFAVYRWHSCAARLRGRAYVTTSLPPLPLPHLFYLFLPHLLYLGLLAVARSPRFSLISPHPVPILHGVSRIACAACALGGGGSVRFYCAFFCALGSC